MDPAAGSIYIGGSGGGEKRGPVRPSTPDDEDAKVTAALNKLPPADRALARAQKLCPVLGSRLGSMGVPVKVVLDGQRVFLCCKGCVKEAEAEPAKTLKRVEELKRKGPSTAVPPKVAAEQERIREAMAKLAPEDRKLAEAQKVCPVTDELLGLMGVPAKVMVQGVPVFICCEGCDEAVLRKPGETLKKVEELKKGK